MSGVKRSASRCDGGSAYDKRAVSHEKGGGFTYYMDESTTVTTTESTRLGDTDSTQSSRKERASMSPATTRNDERIGKDAWVQNHVLTYLTSPRPDWRAEEGGISNNRVTTSQC